MLNGIFVLLIVTSVLVGGFRSTMPAVSDAGIAAAKSAVELAIGLIGQMALWLGFMRIVREAGLLSSIARGLKPVMTRLFHEVPPEHPAMGAMIMNFAANMIGLANAATPFGLKAMKELDRLNQEKGVATNSMALFLAINTSGLAVLPLGAIAVRAAMHSKNAAGIFLPTLFSTSSACVIAIVVAKLIENRSRWSVERAREALGTAASPTDPKPEEAIKGLTEAENLAEARPSSSPLGLAVVFGSLALIAVSIVRRLLEAPEGVLREVMSSWLLPLLMLLIVGVGLARRVRVYETFIQGAKEGFDIAVTIIPYLVAILVAVGMFRASGAMELVIEAIRPLTSVVGIPAETLPMALIRPLSGSGSLAVMSEIMQAHGPDSFPGFVASVMMGSCETTFYVLALYYGSVQVRATRHTLIACLAADVVGLTSAVYWSRLFF